MHVVYKGLDINITATVVIALIGFAKWLISTKKKNAK